MHALYFGFRISMAWPGHTKQEDKKESSVATAKKH